MKDPAPGTPLAAGAFERSLAELRGELLRFAYWLARDRQIAEDVVQESMLRAWKARAGLEDGARLKSWLFTIVRREHARLYERKRLPMVALDEWVAAEELQMVERGRSGGGERGLSSTATAATPAAEGEAAELRAAILRLPDDYREPLVMQVLGGFSTTEIATELGLTQAAVLTRLFRARDKLREAYGLPARGAGSSSRTGGDDDDAQRVEQRDGDDEGERGEGRVR